MSRRDGSWLQLAPLALALALFGCGSDHVLDTAPVTGTVKCQGQPVPPGTITFSPVGEDGKTVIGKAASGQVAADGTFTLTTYESGDGAVIGKHIVSYTPASAGEGVEDEEEDGENSGETSEASSAPVPKKPARGRKRQRLPCEIGGTAEAEVVDGENNLTIELIDWVPGVDQDDDSDAEESED